MLGYRQTEIHDCRNGEPEPDSEQQVPPPTEVMKSAQAEQTDSQDQRHLPECTDDETSIESWLEWSHLASRLV